MNHSERLFLLDAYALIFRAYYALIRMPRLSSTGFNTSAIFGFVNTLEEVLRKENPTHIAVCFDPEGPTFRHEADKTYKAERQATPEDIKLSVPYIKSIIRAYNIPIVQVEGFEADDVIGTLATKAEKEGFTTFMMTPDKDFGQLVTPNILQYKPSYRGQDFELRGPEEVCERYGIQNPHQVIDLLALMGDNVDNIPGCPGIGEKTAVKLIAQFGDVENMLAHTDQIKGANRRKVEENAEQIRFSRFMATIRTDVPVDFDPEQLKRSEPDREQLFALFRELEFRTLEQRVARRLDGDKKPEAEAAPAKPHGPVQASLFDFDNEVVDLQTSLEILDAKAEEVTVVSTAEEATRLDKLLADCRKIGVAMLSDGEGDMAARLVGTGIAVPGGGNWYIPAGSREGMALLLDTLGRPDLLKVMPDVKRAYVIAAGLRDDDSVPVENFYDVAVAHYLIQPEQRHDVYNLAETYLYTRIPRPEPARKKDSLSTLPEQQLAASAGAAAEAALELMPRLEKEIDEARLRNLLDKIEMPLVPVLAKMELTGVLIDFRALAEAADEMQAKIEALEKEIYEMAGMEFNLGSPSKVGEVLFDFLHLDDKAKKTKSGNYSTSEDILLKLAPKNPIVVKILEHRSLRKLLSTYLTTLPEAINPATGRVHTTYNQTTTATGRLSSSNPNLQNIPVREEQGREIRRAFIASPGNVFLSADYSQIELRLVADFANEETMTEAFRNGRDIHAITASKIYRKPLEEVTADERRHAKTANFGILYGISAFGLSQRLNIPRKDAQALIDGYFETFPAIRRYLSQAVEEARENGLVITRMGRRRMLPDINSRNPVVRGYAERNAVNAPIQGTAADIIKKAMIDIDAELRERDLKTKMIMQVHDELNFDVPEEEVPEVQELVARLMENAFLGKVPLTASVGVGSNWLDAH